MKTKRHSKGKIMIIKLSLPSFRMQNCYSLTRATNALVEFPPSPVTGPHCNKAQVQELREIPLLDIFVGPSMHSSSELMACGEETDKLQHSRFSDLIKFNLKYLLSTCHSKHDNI